MALPRSRFMRSYSRAARSRASSCVVGFHWIAALEIGRGQAIHLVGLGLVDVAQHVRGVADLAALRVKRQQLLQEQLGPSLVVGVVVAVPAALILVAHRPGVQAVGVGDVGVGVQRRRRDDPVQGGRGA